MSKDRSSKQAKFEDDADDDFSLFIPKKGDSSQLRRVRPEKEPSIKKYLDMSKQELQQWLRHNGQIITGRKHDLLLRCVDGQLNGRIPGCPKCHHGQMQYDYSEGYYVCNGYFDDLSKTPIRCGHTESEVKREPWHDLEKDAPVPKGRASGKKSSGKEQDDEGTKSSEPHHKEHPDHHHAEHECKVEANHPLVDLLEDMAYYHSVLRDENWGYRARAFKTAANAVEQLDFEVKNAKELGDPNSEHHVERIGKSCAEAMQSYLDSGKKRCPQLEELKQKVEGKEPEEKQA